MNPPGRTTGPLAQYPSPPQHQRASLRRIESRELLGPSGQIIIDHGGQDYRLRITSNGKLLLTNARADGVATKPAFRSAFKKHR